MFYEIYWYSYSTQIYKKKQDIDNSGVNHMVKLNPFQHITKDGVIKKNPYKSMKIVIRHRYNGNIIYTSTDAKNIREAVKEAIHKMVYLDYAMLSRANLDGIKILDAHFRYADLSHSTMRKSIMRYVLFNYANLSHTDMSYIDLLLGNLSNSNLTKAILRRSNLQDTNLSYVTIDKADLRGARLVGSKFIGVDFRKVNLRDISFAGVNLSNANFSGMNLSGLDFRGAILFGTNFQGANLRKTDFSLTKIDNETNFRNTKTWRMKKKAIQKSRGI